jgi:hypothetical protein
MPHLYGNRDAQIPGSSANSASPGFTWGKSGTVGAGTYLLNDTVPSNLSGRLVPVYDGIISEVFVSGEYGSTYTCTIAIEKRNGASWTELTTVSLSSERIKVQTVSSVTLTREDEIAVKVKTGSIKNPVVGVIIKGDSA